MKKLNSLILTALVLLSSGFALRAMPANAERWTAITQTKGAVKAEDDSVKSEVLAQLNLTADQKKKLIAITTDTYKKVAQNLTPEQRQKLETGLKARQGFVPVLKTLNLTADQKKTIGALLVDHRRQLVALLTPEQKKKFEALTANTR